MPTRQNIIEAKRNAKRKLFQTRKKPKYSARVRMIRPRRILLIYPPGTQSFLPQEGHRNG
jgi:hypothetical protein